MPEPGQEETVRVVALDRSFHIQCYKCEVSILIRNDSWFVLILFRFEGLWIGSVFGSGRTRLLSFR